MTTQASAATSTPKTGKRQFPPEWYAKQAARSKAKAASATTAGAKAKAPVKAKASAKPVTNKNFKPSYVHINEFKGKDGSKRNLVTFEGSSTRQLRMHSNVSEASMNRLKKVLAARQKAGKAQNESKVGSNGSNGYTKGKRSSSKDMNGATVRRRMYSISK